MKIEQIIYIEPTPKGRPQTVRRGNKSITYTPHKTAHAESLIREAVLGLKQYFEKGVPLYLEATFFLPRPASTPKKIQLPAKRPDIDNLVKTLTDALEGFVYANDSQITTELLKKRYGSPPRIELRIEEDAEW